MTRVPANAPFTACYSRLQSSALYNVFPFFNFGFHSKFLSFAQPLKIVLESIYDLGLHSPKLVVQCWFSVGSVLVQFGSVLVQCWFSVGSVLVQCWFSVGSVLVQFGFRLGSVGSVLV